MVVWGVWAGGAVGGGYEYSLPGGYRADRRAHVPSTPDLQSEKVVWDV